MVSVMICENEVHLQAGPSTSNPHASPEPQSKERGMDWTLLLCKL